MSGRNQPVAGDSIAYARQDRKADIRHGRRDGRKRIPAYSGVLELIDQAARITTPYQEQLSHTGLYRINEEFRAFLRRTGEHRQHLSRLRPQLVADKQALRRGEEQLAAARAELTEAELLPRNPQELTVIDTTALRGRRMAMRERRIAAAREEHDRRIATVDGRTLQINEVCGQIDHEFALAQARGRRLGDYYVLRIATYWYALTQTHPEGRHLASLVPLLTPTLPSWIAAKCACGVITLPLSAESPPTEPLPNGSPSPESPAAESLPTESLPTESLPNGSPVAESPLVGSPPAGFPTAEPGRPHHAPTHDNPTHDNPIDEARPT